MSNNILNLVKEESLSDVYTNMNLIKQLGLYMNKKELLPDTIDLRITSECNLNCIFCFGPKGKKETKVEEWYSLLDNAKKSGVKNLVLTGGEPLLYPNFQDLVAYAKNLEYKIVLSTNGIKIDNLDNLKYIDALSLPLDGGTYLDCNRMRMLTFEDYTKILNNMRHFKIAYPEKQLKIGTVLTRINLNKVDNIYDIIAGIADVWKIYQVSCHPNNKKKFKNQLEITEEEFRIVYKNLLNKYGDKMRIVSYRNCERSGKYLFCEPNGDAVVIHNNEELTIGNFFLNFNDVLLKWNKYINLELLTKNFEDTYML